jgi:hypothetical protein
MLYYSIALCIALLLYYYITALQLYCYIRRHHDGASFFLEAFIASLCIIHSTASLENCGGLIV